MLFLQRTDCRKRNDPFHAELLEPMDIGAKIQLARQNAMPARMPRQEGHATAFERAHDVSVTGRAEWRLQLNLARVLKSGNVVEPAAADDADLSLSGRW